ncbi:MAG: hypothetical protein EAZ91_18185 [Cytophagales bacterium]|nr:MAG: hypothetical protein EAZ91_18185 [Cytophagales bacterium]
MIKDTIVSGNLQKFQEEFEFINLSEDVAFEHFVNYLTISRINSQAFSNIDSLEKINVDNGKNLGIDGIAFLLNNTLVFNEDNVDLFKKNSENSSNLNVNIIFTQAKATSGGFDLGEVLKFTTAVKDFISNNPSWQGGPDIEEFRDLKEYILSYETLECVDKSSNPVCTLYFVTPGGQNVDSNFLSMIKKQEQEIMELFPVFHSVNIYLIGKDQLIKFYEENQNKIKKRVNFRNKVDLISENGEIKGVGKAFLGYISASEYIKLITDDDGNFMRNLFYENVRDFKGEDNKVNQEIADTIKDGTIKDKFVLFNNGVTIVAKFIDTNFQGGDVQVVNYQIVNGCQTSNVLFLNRHHIRHNDNIMIPLKLIECIDNDITSEITKATNNQNPVPEEAFIALEYFPKTLQAFFESISRKAPEKIFYERRGREYDYVTPKIQQSRIFHLHKLIRAIVAMFIDQPHSTHRFPGEIYKQTSSKIFGKSQKMFSKEQSHYPYYTSCYIG